MKYVLYRTETNDRMPVLAVSQLQQCCPKEPFLASLPLTLLNLRPAQLLSSRRPPRRSLEELVALQKSRESVLSPCVLALP